MNKQGKKRKCPYCKKMFIPDARNQHYQQYCCETDECKKESHRVASARYRQKHRNDEKHKAQECERVKKWQKEHPSYWKKEKKTKNISDKSLLRDILQVEKVTSFPVLRNIVVYLYRTFSGYIAYSTDWDEEDLLRDFIGTRMNLFYDKGIALSSGRKSKLLKEENYHDSKGDRKPWSYAPHA